MPRTQPSLGLFTDLYELTMAQGYWQSGQTAPATFSLFFRKYPPERGYFVVDGGEGLLGEVMRDGKRLRPDPPLEELRSCFRAEFARLLEPLKALRSPSAYDVRISEELEQLRQRVVRGTKERELGGHHTASGEE
jgi:hypothetical protein